MVESLILYNPVPMLNSPLYISSYPIVDVMLLLLSGNSVRCYHCDIKTSVKLPQITTFYASFPRNLQHWLWDWGQNRGLILGDVSLYNHPLNCVLFTLSVRNCKSYLLCIIQLTLRSNCLVLENSPLKLEENLSLGKFFSLLFFALKIIINLQTDLLSFCKSPFKLKIQTTNIAHGS